MRTDEIRAAISPCMDMYIRGTFKMENVPNDLTLLRFCYIYVSNSCFNDDVNFIRQVTVHSSMYSGF
jgi:hypothetical protein